MYILVVQYSGRWSRKKKQRRNFRSEVRLNPSSFVGKSLVVRPHHLLGLQSVNLRKDWLIPLACVALLRSVFTVTEY